MFQDRVKKREGDKWKSDKHCFIQPGKYRREPSVKAGRLSQDNQKKIEKSRCAAGRHNAESPSVDRGSGPIIDQQTDQSGGQIYDGENNQEPDQVPIEIRNATELL